MPASGAGRRFFAMRQRRASPQKNGAYQILGYRKHPRKYWEEDPNQKIQFPAATPIDDVVDRMIAILQDAAQQ
jgi:hypothetical protein